MKSDKERMMEETQAEVSRLEKELAEAKEAADAAWRAYIRRDRPIKSKPDTP